MKVLVIFDPTYEGEAADAVWISDSPANRCWFSSWSDRIDANSAVFDADRYRSPAEAAASIIWSVQEHHPGWIEIEVIGVGLAPALASDLGGETTAEVTRSGFRLIRL